MTKNVCIHCGEMGGGVLIPCQNCEYIPRTSWEIGVAILKSTHCKDQSDLEKYSRFLRERFTTHDAFYEKYGDEDENIIYSFLENPDGRDLLTLKREAQDGLLRKEMNWHFIGPDGYQSKVVRRGRDLGKREYNVFSKHLGTDAFFVVTYINGERKDIQLEKKIWYAAKDLMDLVERRAKGKTKLLDIITSRAWRGTADYLTQNGFDLESALS